MKRVFVILIMAIACLGANITAQDGRTVKGRPVEARLCDSNDLRLELYSDGRCKAVKAGYTPSWGSYTLNTVRTKITINWDENSEHRGDISISSNGYVSVLVIEGVKYYPCK